MRSDQSLMLAAGLLACLSAGAVMGLDAGGHIDSFYTTPRVHPERLPPMPQSSPYDWDQPPASTTTWASATGGQSVAIVGGAHDDGSDLTALDRQVERASMVRVHRARHARVERVVVDDPADHEFVEEPLPDA